MPNPIYIILNDAYYKKNKIYQYYQESNNKIIRTFGTSTDKIICNKETINSTEFRKSIFKLLERSLSQAPDSTRNHAQAPDF